MRRVGVFLILVVFMVATGCETAVEMLTTVAGVTLDKESLELVEGAQEQLEATLIPATAIERTVMWTSSDEAVVSVDANGLLTARKAGKADVTVTTKEGGYKATCSVTVLAKPQKVTGVIIDNEDVQLGVGLQEQLKAIVLPLGAANKAVSWSSSDETVVTVDANGLLTGRKAGKADVTVTTQEGGFTASIEVTVVVKVTGIRLEQKKQLLQIGKSHQFKAVVLPEDATDKRVVWQSSDEEIFTVDQAGNVHAVSKGGDLLIVKTVEGGFTDACVVDVTDYVPVEVVDISPAVATLTVGEKREFAISFSPSTAEWQLVEPSIQNDVIATVKQKDDHTVVVTGKAEGDTKLEVTVDARVKGYASIKVIQGHIKPLRDITWDLMDDVMLFLDDEYTAGTDLSEGIAFDPEDATNKAVTWTSSDETVAKVSSDGWCSGKSEGTCTITVASQENPNIKCEITVWVHNSR